MIAVAFAGHTGRVGTAVVPGLRSTPGIEYVGGVGRGDDLVQLLRGGRPQVLIDFTVPSAAKENALLAAHLGVAPVVGTSGLAPADVDQIEAACAEAGVGGMVAPNFAVGAVVMMWLAELAAPYFDAVEVVEAHHASKLDVPSGTATATARRLAAARAGRPFDHAVPHTVNLPAARGGELEGVGVHSLRLPGVLADQDVIFGVAGQTLTIGHRTLSREAFLPGILMAVRAVASGPGFHRGLDELLGLGRPITGDPTR